MQPPDPGGSGRRKRLAAAVDDRVALIDSGSYSRTTEYVLHEKFLAFLGSEFPTVEHVDDVEVKHCRAYAEHLREEARDPDEDVGTASTCESGPYFTVVRAFFGFCVDEEWLARNPARPNRVTRALPEHVDDPDRQFWGREERAALLDHVDRAVEAGIGRPGSFRRDPDAIVLYRDRALVATLAFAGVRGGEALRASNDPQRTGLRWSDVDPEAGVAVVLGKSREREPVGLPGRVVTCLERLKRVLQPASDAWPVFPSNHTPGLSEAVTTGLSRQGYDDEEAAAIRDSRTLWEVCYEYDVAPPALSANGGRSVLRRLCEEAGVEVDGEYLKPHGARRQLGDELYDVDPTAAQDTLRHRNIGTTHASYRDKQAVETARDVEEIVDGAADPD